jgi:hypothetical protein
VAKLTSLPFNQAKVATISTDFQPSISGGIIVFVTGQVQVGVGRTGSCKASRRTACTGVGLAQRHEVELHALGRVQACSSAQRRGEAAARGGCSSAESPLWRRGSRWHFAADPGCFAISYHARSQTEGESNALKFSQVFHLMPVGSSFVVTNGAQAGSVETGAATRARRLARALEHWRDPACSKQRKAARRPPGQDALGLEQLGRQCCRAPRPWPHPRLHPNPTCAVAAAPLPSLCLQICSGLTTAEGAYGKRWCPYRIAFARAAAAPRLN